MKIIKYLLGIIITIALLAIVCSYAYMQHLKPDYEGEIELTSLDETVEVFYDKYGVPHIEAKSDKDAFKALGYVHARERLWQMELIRRIAAGRLSEIFGSKLVKTDKFFRTLGTHVYAQESAERFKSENGVVQELTKAYLEGINAYQNEGVTPVEFTLLGVEKTPFTVEDVYNVIGYMAFNFAHGFKTEPVASAIAQMGNEYLEVFDLGPGLATIKNHDPSNDELQLSVIINEVFDKLPQPPLIGSNSWVLSPKKSATGKVMFCNDPHIGYSQPAVWFEAHIKSPSYNYVGHHLAGVPFAILTQSDQKATGMTMLENDDMDFYYEKINPKNENEYWAVDHWETLDIRKERILVKDSVDVEFEVKQSAHGPIITTASDNFDSTRPVSLWWSYLKLPNHLLEASHGMMSARNIGDMRKAVEKIHGPGLNIMYGDSSGNIAWWAGAKLIKRPSHVNSKFILDGITGKDDPLGYHSFAENPHAENPPWGYVYSANNQTTLNITDTTILYPGYYLPGSRAKRIVEVLESKPVHNKQDMKDLFLDTKSIIGLSVRNDLVNLISRSELNQVEVDALDIFESWNGMHKSDTKGAALFYAHMVFIYQQAMLDDFTTIYGEQGKQYMKTFMTNFLMKRSMQKFINSENSPWWDDKSTKDIETREEIITKSFKSAVVYLKERFGDDWSWSNIHTLEHPHALGTVDALRPFFNIGPNPVEGSDMVVNANGFPYNTESLYNVSFGPSTRRLIDFSDPDSSESILPTGQSGVVSSPHYDDQVEMFNHGKWKPVYFSAKAIKENSTVLTLTPKN